MKRITRHSSTIMILVALILVLHPFITRHHHFEISSKEYCSCPIDTSLKKNHNEGNHCHIFNDLNEDKKSISVHRYYLPLFFTVGNDAKLIKLYEQPLFGMPTSTVKALYNRCIFINHILRGPPSAKMV